MMLETEQHTCQIFDPESSTHPEVLGLLNWIQGFQVAIEGDSVADTISPRFSSDFQVSVLDQAIGSWLLFDHTSHYNACWKVALDHKSLWAVS